MNPRRPIESLCLLVALLLLVLAPPAASGAADGDELVTRSFEIRYQSFQDAILVVTEIVASRGTEDGQVLYQHSLKRITVTDVRPVVETVAQALRSFDVPPRQVQVRMTLFLASRGETAASENALKEVYNSVVSELRRELTYTSYEPLGHLSVPSVEGHAEPTSVTFGDGYTVEFRVRRVDPERRLIQLDPLVLSRKRGGDAEGLERLLATAVNLTAGQPFIQGASSGPSSDRALLLSIEADTIELD